MFGVDDALAAGILSAGASVISTGASAAAQASLNRKTMKFNREEAEKQRLWSEQQAAQQNAWNMENWARMQEYNTPAAQLSRLREAGLNPLYYGLDGNSTGQAFEAAQPLGYERAQVGNLQNPFDNMRNPIDAALTAQQQVAQISNIQADTAKKNNENLTETQRREKLIADIEVAKQSLENMVADKSLTEAKRDDILKGISWIDRLNEATLAEKQANAALSRSNKKRIEELLDGEKLIQSQTIEDFNRKWAKIDAEIAKIAAETGILDKDLQNYALNHLQSGFMGTGVSLPNYFRGLATIREKRIKEKKTHVKEGPPDMFGYSGSR